MVVVGVFLAAIALPGSLGRGAGWILWGLAGVGALGLYSRLEAKIRYTGVRAGIALSVGALAAADGILIWLGDPGLVLEFVGGGFALVLASLGLDQIFRWVKDLPSRISGQRDYYSPSPSPWEAAGPPTDPRVAAARLERKLERARSRPLQPKPAKSSKAKSSGSSRANPIGSSQAKPTRSSQPKPSWSSQAPSVPPVPSPQVIESRRFRDELDDVAAELWRAAEDRLQASYGSDWLTTVNERRVAHNHSEVKPDDVGVEPRVALRLIAYDRAFERTVEPISRQVKFLHWAANKVHHAKPLSDNDLSRARAALRRLLEMARDSQI